MKINQILATLILATLFVSCKDRVKTDNTGNENVICQISLSTNKLMSDIKEVLKLIDNSPALTKSQEKEILRIQNETNRLESVSDNYFEVRGEVTREDVKVNFAALKSCPSYREYTVEDGLFIEKFESYKTK
jgi:hypothetical protein